MADNFELDDISAAVLILGLWLFFLPAAAGYLIGYRYTFGSAVMRDVSENFLQSSKLPRMI